MEGYKGNLHALAENEIRFLKEFIADRDRGATKTFVGRKSELSELTSRLKRVESRGSDPSFIHAPAADMTLVIQGAPGAGKSAVLAKIAEDWSPDRKGKPCALSVDPGLLKLPMDSLVSSVSRNLTKRSSGIARNLIDLAQSVTVGLPGIGSVELNIAEFPTSSTSLVPVILLFDEIQSVLGEDMPAEARMNLTDNIRLLHTGVHGLPIFPIYGGLANSGDLLRKLGLTRLGSGSERTLKRFSDDITGELMRKFVVTFLSSAVPSDETVEQWTQILILDSQGWPMHCRNFLNALAIGIRKSGWRPGGVDIDQVRMQAASMRAEYYAHRLAFPLEERPGLVSILLEKLMRTGPLSRECTVSEIRNADERERENPDHQQDHRWKLPNETDPSRAFEAMLHAGIVQKAPLEGYECPIPSLSSYMAARAANPSGRLHNAVISGDIDAMEDIIELNNGQVEQSEILNATDVRCRTPLILALETSMYPLVCLLVEKEFGLPNHLRSFAQKDANGRQACDHASVSDDHRIRALAEDLQPLETL